MKEILKKLKDITFYDIPDAQEKLRHDSTLTPMQAAREINNLEEVKERILDILVDG